VVDRVQTACGSGGDFWKQLPCTANWLWATASKTLEQYALHRQESTQIWIFKSQFRAHRQHSINVNNIQGGLTLRKSQFGPTISPHCCGGKLFTFLIQIWGQIRRISSGPVFMISTRAQRKLLHNWIIIVIVNNLLVQIGRIDGPIEYLSEILTAIKSIADFFSVVTWCGCLKEIPNGPRYKFAAKECWWDPQDCWVLRPGFVAENPTTQWSTRVSLGCYVTKFAPHKALKWIAWCKLTFDERVELLRVDRAGSPPGNKWRSWQQIDFWSKLTFGPNWLLVQIDFWSISFPTRWTTRPWFWKSSRSI